MTSWSSLWVQGLVVESPHRAQRPGPILKMAPRSIKVARNFEALPVPNSVVPGSFQVGKGELGRHRPLTIGTRFHMLFKKDSLDRRLDLELISQHRGSQVDDFETSHGENKTLTGVMRRRQADAFEELAPSHLQPAQVVHVIDDASRFRVRIANSRFHIVFSLFTVEGRRWQRNGNGWVSRACWS